MNRLLVKALVLAITPVALAAALVSTSVVPAAAQTYVRPTPRPSGGVNAQVYATLVVGDTVFMGGSFTTAVGRKGATSPRGHLAAFSLKTGALLRSWRADTNGTVRTLASSGGWLYVGGNYTAIGGTDRGYLARVSLSKGAVDPGFHPALDGQVLALAPDENAIFAGGGFGHVGSTRERFLAKLDAETGTLDPSFSAGASGSIQGLAIDPAGGDLYVAGDFTELAGVSRIGLGSVNAGTGAITGPAFPGSIKPMLDVTFNRHGTILYAGSGNWNNTVAAWNPATGARLWHVKVGGDVQALAHYRGRIFVGAHGKYHGHPDIKLLAMNGSTGAVDKHFRPTFNHFWGVRAISASPTGLVIGGDFTRVSGVRARNWARFPVSRHSAKLVKYHARWSWRYRHGAPPAKWAKRGFDASSWARGRAVLGFGSPSVATWINTHHKKSQRPLTAYFRHSFHLKHASRVKSLKLTTVADDGVVVYVNGTKVGRANMPSGRITHRTSARSAVRTTKASTARFAVPTRLLVHGTNVIAAETHLRHHRTQNVTFHLVARASVAN